MGEAFEITGPVQRFDRPGGWFYVELPDSPGFDLRSLVEAAWPQLLAADCTVRNTTWPGSVMPTKDGPLFIALTKPVREAERLEVGERVTLQVQLVAGN